MSNVSWERIQDEIARRYCGTVLVLDDEIITKTTKGKKKEESYNLNPLFHEAKRAFEDQGVICDLRQIDDDLDSRPIRTSIKKQLQRADTLVVDWYLGAGKEVLHDPGNAIQILKDLNKMPGFRFVAIHSKEQPQTILDALRGAFGAQLRAISSTVTKGHGEEDDTAVLTEDEQLLAAKANAESSTYRIGKSLYLCIVHKDKLASATELPKQFFNHLKSVFPDQLHWIGFEFAGRIKEVLPQLLSTLPTKTDVALVFQALLQQDNEVADCVVECLALEVQEMLKSSPLESAQDKTVIGRLLERVKKKFESTGHGLPNASADTKGKWQQADINILKAACSETEHKFQPVFFEFFPTARKQNERAGLKSHRSELSAFIATALDQAGTFDPITYHAPYAAFREHLQTAHPLRLLPGVILRKKEVAKLRGAKKSPEWLLCVSPVCDCVRGDEERRYLFVGGSTSAAGTKSKGTMQTCLRVGEECHHVEWSSASFQTIDCAPKGPPDYRLITRLHQDVLLKLIQAIWSYQSRVGVNTSDYVRTVRGD